MGVPLFGSAQKQTAMPSCRSSCGFVAKKRTAGRNGWDVRCVSSASFEHNSFYRKRWLDASDFKFRHWVKANTPTRVCALMLTTFIELNTWKSPHVTDLFHQNSILIISCIRRRQRDKSQRFSDCICNSSQSRECCPSSFRTLHTPRRLEVALFQCSCHKPNSHPHRTRPWRIWLWQNQQVRAGRTQAEPHIPSAEGRTSSEPSGMKFALRQRKAIRTFTSFPLHRTCHELPSVKGTKKPVRWILASQAHKNNKENLRHVTLSVLEISVFGLST